MLIEDYEKVYALWTICDGIGLNNLDWMILGMDDEKQQIYPSWEKNFGYGWGKTANIPKREKIESMDFFFIKHNIPDGEFCHKIIIAL